MLRGHLDTVLGWRVWVGSGTNGRSLRNFPMQANGAEMLRLACCLATERGVRVAAPVHDALLVVAPQERLEAVLESTVRAMDEACDIVLGGRLRLRTDAEVVSYPKRYMDPRGARMWEVVWQIVEDLEASDGGRSFSRQRDEEVAPPRITCRRSANPSTPISLLSPLSTSTPVGV